MASVDSPDLVFFNPKIDMTYGVLATRAMHTTRRETLEERKHRDNDSS